MPSDAMSRESWTVASVFFSSRRRHTRFDCDWSSDVCSSDLVSLGSPGFAVFVKAFDRAPTLQDLNAMKAAVEDTSLASRIPPARILVLWRAKGDESVSPDAYEFLTKEAARVRLRGSSFVCSLELAVERDNGTYDFIPLVLEPAAVPGGRPSTG